MKPIKITMTAFGPYKDKEVIDFTELKENRLFVISGNTGAGKTTIFDAISFALYGAASGEDRSDTKFMRSDFAEDDVHTSVELEFELHHHLYRIKRQLPHVKKGNKSATGEQYEFFEKKNGKEVPCVDRQMVSEINKKIESLMGLTKDQFSQIVMLPQGEFRKLLTSETTNKEEILRKIFKTEPYLWINERLKEKKKLAEDDFKREAHTRDGFIRDIQSTIPEREGSVLFETLLQKSYNTNQVLAGLDEETAYYQDEMEKNQKQAKEAEGVYNQKLEAFHKAEQLNEQFKKLEDKEETLNELTGQVPIFAEKEKQLERAERASKIESYEKQVIEWRQDEKEKKQKLVMAEGEQERAGKQLAKAQGDYKTEENKKADREELVRKLDRYQSFLPTVKEIDSKKLELMSLQKEVRRLEDDLDLLQKKIKDEKAVKDQLRTTIKGMEKEVDQLSEKQKKVVEMRDRVRILHEYLKLNENHIEFEQLFKTKKQDYLEIKDQYDKLEEAWVNGQATILAAHLHDGKPCPVCGSIEHPNKAQGQDTVPTKDELEQVKNKLNSKDSDYRDAAAKLKANKYQFDIKSAEVAEIGVPIQDVQHEYNQLASEGKRLSSEVKLLEKEKENLDKVKKNLEKKEKELEQLEAEQTDKAKAYQEQHTSFETKKAVYKEQVNQIPEDIRILTLLEQKIAETQAQKTRMERAWETAQKLLQSAKVAETKAAADLLNARKQLEESNNKKEKSETEFAQLLVNAHFSSEEAYHGAKLPEQERAHLKDEINTFKNNLASLQQLVKELQDSLKNKTKADLAVLATEVDNLKKIFEDADVVLRQSTHYHQKAAELRTKIFEAEKSVAELERQFTIVTDLYDVVRGQNNSKISFERYIQIEFLEQIIIAANERLKHLSNGQFLLMRSERQESRGKQSGLGLDVYDAYTGQTRDVKTLSGGEKFNASLCLALGMADVIQSFQGGVSIDTMFIDEGFGSLDEESLNKAIDTLIDLQQSGRMIGVISHVQELKDAIPAILEVKKTKEGHSQTKFVLK
ncbi:AAA family ATPase [Bacillus sp. EB600]|uniref:AAA family ATPase n=1 Tax=Bacillus sp. EB600 TaxID=2806345 RepID=UPI002108F70C|nr:AAA family ATPase [Bacillus sp. EB600]MCQ6279659.1 AAA family ATPase [Bacillus sp. EB600]